MTDTAENTDPSAYDTTIEDHIWHYHIKVWELSEEVRKRYQELYGHRLEPHILFWRRRVHSRRSRIMLKLHKRVRRARRLMDLWERAKEEAQEETRKREAERERSSDLNL